MTIEQLLFSLKGRISRRHFWSVVAINALVGGCLLVIGLWSQSFALPVVWSVLMLYPSLAVNVKRCHDRGRSGWLVLVSFVPILNIWYLIEVAFLPGTDGDNEYGPMPVRLDLSLFGRIMGVLFSPKATFEDIVRKPNWLLPFAIMIALGFLSAACLNQRMNWREYVSDQIEKSPRAAQLSAEQKAMQIEYGARFAPISTYVFAGPAPSVILLIVTLVMWGAYTLLGGANTNFKTSLGIVSRAFVPSYLGSLLFFVVLFLKPVGTVDLQTTIVAGFITQILETAL